MAGKGKIGVLPKKEIIIDDKKLQSFAERMLPHAIKISEYLALHTEIYIELNRYEGAAKKEFDRYEDDQLKQLHLLSENYLCLATILNDIVLKFIEADENYEARINGYANSIVANYGDKNVG